MKDVLVYVATGYEEVEMLTIVDLVRRAGLKADMVSMTGDRVVVSAHGVSVQTDAVYDDIDVEDYRAYFIPGGMPGAKNLQEDTRVTRDLKKAYEDGKDVFAICAGPIVLEAAGLLEGKEGTSFPGFEDDLSLKTYKEDLFVQDGRVHTSRGPATAMYFAVHMVEVLGGKERAKALAEELLLDKVVATIKAGK